MRLHPISINATIVYFLADFREESIYGLLGGALSPFSFITASMQKSARLYPAIHPATDSSPKYQADTTADN
jgi:hypothetical protein